MKMTPRARSALGVAALLAAGLLAGCEDEEDPPEPTESSSEPTSSATNPTTKPAEPTLPPIGIVRAWVAAYNSATQSGDTSDADALTGRECATCDELLSSIEDVIGNGGSFQGGRWTIDAARVTRRSPNSATVTAGITAASGTTQSSSGAPPESYPEERFALEFEVSRRTVPSVVTTIVFLS